MGKSLYYLGRFGQLVGMWLLLVDVVTAGPLGPNPKLFAVGVAVFGRLGPDTIGKIVAASA